MLGCLTAPDLKPTGSSNVEINVFYICRCPRHRFPRRRGPPDDPKTLQDWVGALEDRDPEVSLKAARSWVRALGDADPAWRIFAALALVKIGPDAKPAVPALRECLRDGRGRVRARPLMCSRRSVPPPRKRSPNSSAPLSDDRAGGFAAPALEAMGPAGVAALKAVLKDGDKRTRPYADSTLKRMGVES